MLKRVECISKHVKFKMCMGGQKINVHGGLDLPPLTQLSTGALILVITQSYVTFELGGGGH